MKEFRLIVAGGRDFLNRELMDTWIKQVLSELPDDLLVSIVSGMAPGADTLAYQWALANKCKVYKYYAQWQAEGKRAGFIRNQKMCDDSDGLLAFWDGQSKGTRHMIQIARNAGLYVKVINY